jgi:hypothetical protein
MASTNEVNSGAVTPAPDGKTRGAYNTAHGRKANAPLSGGSRQAAYDALLSKKTKGDPYRDRSKKS